MAGHDHDHEEHTAPGSELSEMQLRVWAPETILPEKGYVDPAVLDAIIAAYETKNGPHNGAWVVAQAMDESRAQEEGAGDARPVGRS